MWTPTTSSHTVVKELVMPTLTPFIWFDDDLQEAVELYVGIFPDGEIHDIQRTESGEWFYGTFTLAGQTFYGMNGGPGHPHTDSFSIFVTCDDQAEVDRYWDALTEGGTEVACGWLTDRFGVSWQIVPKRLMELQADPDPTKVQRVVQAMLKMVKLDVAELERAADEG
jgi:predicted 3-demethylubiquinone-9 3-methyltransferase (glyoxalase superfamily)